MKIVLFEDDHVRQLYPVTLSRPAFGISVGGVRLIDLALALSDNVTCVVRPHLRDMYEADYPHHAPAPVQGQQRLLINARLVPSLEAQRVLQALIRAGRPALLTSGGLIAAALLDADQPLPMIDPTQEAVTQLLEHLQLPVQAGELPLLAYPHEIVKHNMALIGPNTEARLAAGGFEQRGDGFFVAPGAEIGAYVTTDTTKGPIVVEAGAQIGPYCFLRGPVHIGPRARVIEHAAIKDGVYLGHTTKIGGEIEASVVEPYTNKQHHGFLGHSYLGSWINLGAGTANSDLKNTYGQVNMEYQGRKVSTRMQFIGCIVGDYAKTAINTAIFTGKTIGVCSMVYGFVTTNVPSFVNYARSFGQVSETPVDVMVATQARMFERRSVAQRECDKQLLYAMYELTRNERQLSGDPLQF
ncbi:MAG: glucose-1-phosphate thymidylyltransferase [Pirellulales bacterium]|nr:glucose-1-phosphate thymidylyltransferase [Pirellulales bacterium]